jgi:nudix-type nucleoside diphosphatase (YffH/AdpP family)
MADERARMLSSEVLSHVWGKLTRYTIAFTRRDGRSETQIREVYDHGDGAAVLPFDRRRGTVLLVRQFRLPVWLRDGNGIIVEACAGLLDGLDPESAIRKEAEEELGYRLHRVTPVFATWSSPGSLGETMTLFVADYTPADRISDGGGAAQEGEDIEVIELPLDEAFAMVSRGEIADAKTIVLLQHAKLSG